MRREPFPFCFPRVPGHAGASSAAPPSLSSFRAPVGACRLPLFCFLSLSIFPGFGCRQGKRKRGAGRHPRASVEATKWGGSVGRASRAPHASRSEGWGSRRHRMGGVGEWTGCKAGLSFLPVVVGYFYCFFRAIFSCSPPCGGEKETPKKKKCLDRHSVEG